MVRKDLVSDRLERLREYVNILKAVQKYDIDRFTTDPFIHGAAERYLHLAIESLLDIGNHIISDQGFRKPETYADIFQILADQNIIPPELLQELEGMAAFRNILVHDYLRLDLEKIYQLIQKKLPSLESLATIQSTKNYAP